ncbi:MAG: imidazole glycerol phosphate synthase subunit HisH [Gammaproteobacteria bacterium]|nr:imidazole glycerol phosphate synthase subunit HisH [Gammaproteobacteria bacterium]
MSSAGDTVIIDSGGANLASLRFALERLGVAARLARGPGDLAQASRAILPGVGAAADAMQRLSGSGLDDAVRRYDRPLLGICLGMQLLFERSDEGDTPCLGLLPGRVTALVPAPGRPVPHMGWNTLQTVRPDPLLAGLGADDWVYFVHGYHVPAEDADAALLARTDYGVPVTAAVRRGNFMGVQFHPERSGAAGARLLANFLAMDGR